MGPILMALLSDKLAGKKTDLKALNPFRPKDYSRTLPRIELQSPIRVRRRKPRGLI